MGGARSTHCIDLFISNTSTPGQHLYRNFIDGYTAPWTWWFYWNMVRFPHVTATYKLYLTTALSAQAGEMPALFTLHSHWVSVVHFTDDGVGILVGTGFWAIGVGTMLVVSSTEYTQWIVEKETEMLISIQMQVLKCQFYSHVVVQEEPFLKAMDTKGSDFMTYPSTSRTVNHR